MVLGCWRGGCKVQCRASSWPQLLRLGTILRRYSEAAIAELGREQIYRETLDSLNAIDHGVGCRMRVGKVWRVKSGWVAHDLQRCRCSPPQFCNLGNFHLVTWRSCLILGYWIDVLDCTDDGPPYRRGAGKGVSFPAPCLRTANITHGTVRNTSTLSCRTTRQMRRPGGKRVR